MLVKCRCLGGREGSSPSGVMVVTAHLEPSRYPPTGHLIPRAQDRQA